METIKQLLANEKLKKAVSFALVVALVAVGFLWFGKTNLEHIEDTNGPENYALQVLTDDNIRKLDVGARNVGQSTSFLTGDTVTYSSKKFTGVYEVFSTNIITNRYEIIVNHARVDAGNFKMVLCVDNEIIHEFALNELTQSFVLENVRGTISLRIAGESADFMFDYYVL